MKPATEVLQARKRRRQAQAGRRALLIVGTAVGKSAPPGPPAEVPAAPAAGGQAEAMRRVGEHARRIVEALAAHGIDVEVRVTLRRKHATRAARDAARAGVQLVIAGGGDETVSAVASGLLGTQSVLGIVPPDAEDAGHGRDGGGMAAFLGVPEELRAACDLLASSPGLPMDVGQVTVAQHKTPRLFFSRGAVGLIADMMPAGQDVADRWWGGPVKSQPAPPHLTPTPAHVRLDKAEPGRRATTLLVEVENAPHGPAGCVSPAGGAGDAPEALADTEEGASAAEHAPGLDVRIYHDLDHVDLAARFVALEAGESPKVARIERARAMRVDVRTATPMPVTADSHVIGTTPARFDLLPAALLVALGRVAGRDGGELPVGGAGSGTAARPARGAPQARSAAQRGEGGHP